MALPKKKSRIITVNSISYRWLSSGSDEGVNVYVELADNPGQMLCNRFEYEYDKNDNRIGITPAHIKNLIEMALSAGWKPEENGPDLPMYKVYQKIDGEKK